MRIGIDFDNTIVSYDAVFHTVAVERGLILPATPGRKLAVRDYLRGVGQEDRWTELQGYVYGARMGDAQAYPGAIEFMRRATDSGHSLAIISHKTRRPFLGQQYDLHAAARSWIEVNLIWKDSPLVDETLVHFELTKAEKLQRIGELGCDVFIDDLPEILLAPDFPPRAARLLFDPDSHHDSTIDGGVRVFRSWDEIAAELCR